jgi:hypothetical protein
MERKHTSNPVEIDLHAYSVARIVKAANRFYADGCSLEPTERLTNRHFTFSVEASDRHGHAGLTYQVEIYRAEDHTVRGRCTCAAQPTHRNPDAGLCKHLAACYLTAKFLVSLLHLNCLVCGDIFESLNLSICPDCLTAPALAQLVTSFVPNWPPPQTKPAPAPLDPAALLSDTAVAELNHELFGAA